MIKLNVSILFYPCSLVTGVATVGGFDGLIVLDVFPHDHNGEFVFLARIEPATFCLASKPLNYGATSIQSSKRSELFVTMSNLHIPKITLILKRSCLCAEATAHHRDASMSIQTLVLTVGVLLESSGSTYLYFLMTFTTEAPNTHHHAHS